MDPRKKPQNENELKGASSQIDRPTNAPLAKRRFGNILPFVLIFLLLLGLILAVKPIRQKIFKRVGQNVTQITPLPTRISDNFSSPTPSTSYPTHAISPTKTPSLGGDKSDRYGINKGTLVPEEPYFDAALTKAGELGVGWFRLGADWSDLEPSDNNWNFSSSDKLVDTAISKGLNVLYEFDPDLNGKFCTMSPAEVSLGRKPLCSEEQFKDYITQIVSRYKGKVMYYELGNEPDLRRTWRNNPTEYAKALALAYPVLKAADPNAKLLIGGLAMGGGQSSDPQYPQKLVAAGALNNFDIMNYHTYDKKENITRQFNLVKSFVGNKPIWITEIGYPADPAHQQKYRAGYPYPGGEEGQAKYIEDILPHLLSLGVEKVFLYNLVDVPRDNSAFCTYGLMYIPGKQCLDIGESEGRKIGGELKTKKSYDTYKGLTLSR